MAEDLCVAGIPCSLSSPSSSAKELHEDRVDHVRDIDLDSFFLWSPSDPMSPSNASASSPSSFEANRSHPPLRNRRCLFGASSPPADISFGTKLSRPAPLLTPNSDPKCRKRGAYNCGRCGQPKRGHVCVGETSPKNLVSPEYRKSLQPLARPPCTGDQIPLFVSPRCLPLPRTRSLSSEGFLPASSSSLTSSCSSNERSKLAELQLQLAVAGSESAEASAVVAEGEGSIYSDNSSYDLEINAEEEFQAMPLACLVQILSRLFPQDLVAASSVCRRWRQCAEYVWAGLRKTIISIQPSQLDRDFDGNYLPFILRKCFNLQHLTLQVKSLIGDQLLRNISNLSSYLSSLEVSLNPGGKNATTGEGLRDLLRQCRSLTSAKFESCDRMVEVELSSPRLVTLWLTGCHRLKYMFLDCPDLSELCLDFLPPGGKLQTLVDRDSIVQSDGIAVILKNLATSCKGLTRLHIASPLLEDRAIHGLFSPGLKSLRMLSLTFGSGITDSSVYSIAAGCERLELLDLSGSSITDTALELICKSFSTSLSNLLIALCPRVSQVGLQMVVSGLPLLQLLDCGKVIMNKITRPWLDNAHTSPKANGHLRFHHQQLKKLSLWGCTGLEMLALDCPNLEDLNLTGCSRLQSGELQLICPSLKDIYVGNCEEGLVHAIHCQLEMARFDTKPVWRAQAERCKRVQAHRPATRVLR